MKMIWKKEKNSKKGSIGIYPNLPFHPQTKGDVDSNLNGTEDSGAGESQLAAYSENSAIVGKQLAESFREEGNKLAEEGKYREALGKWETSLNMMPDNAALHEQKAQVLLEFGDAWSALKSAARATELEPSWAEAWITLGRSQLNFGEPDSAIESFDTALALKPDCAEAKEDRKAALHLVKRRKQLHSSGLSSDKNRFLVGDTSDNL